MNVQQKQQQYGSTVSVSHERELHLSEDLWDYLREYTRQKPETVAIWSFAIGFILGWKIKPW